MLLFQVKDKSKSKLGLSMKGQNEDLFEKVERVSKEKNLFIEGMSVLEQELLSVCISETNFSIPQIKDDDVISAIKLYKMLYCKIKGANFSDKTLVTDLSHIKDGDFLNTKIERLAKKQLQDPTQILLVSTDNWVKSLCSHCPFILAFNTRMMMFRMYCFDKPRSLYFLTQHAKGGNIAGLSIPGLNIGKLQRLKLKVNRKAILDCGVKVMNSHGSTHTLLEFDFFDESGSGLGPTLEFYSLSSAALRELDFLWRPMDKGTLFPAPINPDNWESGIKGVSTSKICQLFKYAGWLCARTIIDDRLSDLPFADIFWELVLGKNATISDLKKVDMRNGAFFVELDRLKERKAAIQRNSSLNEEQKKRQIESLTIGVLFN